MSESKAKSTKMVSKKKRSNSSSRFHVAPPGEVGKLVQMKSGRPSRRLPRNNWQPKTNRNKKGKK